MCNATGGPRPTCMVQTKFAATHARTESATLADGGNFAIADANRIDTACILAPTARILSAAGVGKAPGVGRIMAQRILFRGKSGHRGIFL